MKILTIVETLTIGGAESFVLRFSSELKEDGHDVRIFCLYGDLIDEEFVQHLAPKLHVYRFPSLLGRWLRRLEWFLETRLNLGLFLVRAAFSLWSSVFVLSRFKPDVIHSHLIPPDAVAADLSRLWRIPAVCTIHGDYLQDRWTRGGAHWMVKPRLEQMSQIICVSSHQVRFLCQKFPSLSHKIKLIYNGYRLRRGSTDDWRSRFGIQPGQIVFGMVSRGIESKGWDIAIDAFKKLNRAETYLVLVGQGPCLESLRLANTSSGRIYFVGASSSPMDWIKDFDICLLPTRYRSESLPTVVIEYLACSKPVIATDVGDISRMITYQERSAGLLIELGDRDMMVDSLVEAMGKYIDDSQIRFTHIENSSCVFEQFEMDRCKDAYIGLYETVISAHAR